MTQQEKDAALAKMDKLYLARRGLPGYKQNVETIRAEMEALKAITVSG